MREDRPAEVPEVSRVAPKEPARLLQQTENPLQAAVLHPQRRTLPSTRQKINRRSHTHRDRHAQRFIMHGDPLFGLGATEGDKQQIRLRGANPTEDLIVIHFKQRAKRRRVMADAQLGIASLEFVHSFGRDFGRSSQEKEPIAFLCRQFNESRRQI